MVKNEGVSQEITVQLLFSTANFLQILFKILSIKNFISS